MKERKKKRKEYKKKEKETLLLSFGNLISWNERKIKDDKYFIIEQFYRLFILKNENQRKTLSNVHLNAIDRSKQKWRLQMKMFTLMGLIRFTLTKSNAYLSRSLCLFFITLDQRAYVSRWNTDRLKAGTNAVSMKAVICYFSLSLILVSLPVSSIQFLLRYHSKQIVFGPAFKLSD